jgi:hypothetical protein
MLLFAAGTQRRMAVFVGGRRVPRGQSPVHQPKRVSHACGDADGGLEDVYGGENPHRSLYAACPKSGGMDRDGCTRLVNGLCHVGTPGQAD